MEIKRLLLAFTTLACLTLIGNSSGIARTGNIRVENRLSLALPSGSKHEHKPGDDSHHPGIMEIPGGQSVPSVDLIVHPDPMKGWNLEIQVTNFKFAPERASTEAVPGEGHAHLFINGEKVTRLYGSWYYLGNLNLGRNEIKVKLNGNDHADLAHHGKMIEDTEVVEVTALIPSSDRAN